mmetsp:Transcript_106244/g.298805  ORF Transcript_106244/g.298805 Transcript_106244/m.298805 type:complete len:207 (-) Transcript_106244:18-638(-)
MQGHHGEASSWRSHTHQGGPGALPARVEDLGVRQWLRIPAASDAQHVADEVYTRVERRNAVRRQWLRILHTTCQTVVILDLERLRMWRNTRFLLDERFQLVNCRPHAHVQATKVIAMREYRDGNFAQLGIAVGLEEIASVGASKATQKLLAQRIHDIFACAAALQVSEDTSMEFIHELLAAWFRVGHCIWRRIGCGPHLLDPAPQA